MLVNTKEILTKAQQGQYAVAAFKKQRRLLSR